jgi:hypothetical protein
MYQVRSVSISQRLIVPSFIEACDQQSDRAPPVPSRGQRRAPRLYALFASTGFREIRAPWHMGRGALRRHRARIWQVNQLICVKGGLAVPLYRFKAYQKEPTMLTLTLGRKADSAIEAMARWARNLARSGDWLEESIGADEMRHIAQDLGMSVSDLHQLITSGSDNSELMLRRMRALGIDPEQFAREELACFREFQRACSLCAARGRCVHDLAAADPLLSPDWKDYCPNAPIMNMLSAVRAAAQVNDGERQHAQA